MMNEIDRAIAELENDQAFAPSRPMTPHTSNADQLAMAIRTARNKLPLILT